MRKINLLVYIIMCAAAVFLCAGAGESVSATGAGKVLGTASGTKDTALLSAFGTWVPMDGKLFPVVDGSTVRAQAGSVAVQTRDSTRVDVAKNSEVTLTGARGAYGLKIARGAVSFRVPEGVSLVVSTPTATVEAPASATTPGKASVSSASDRVGVVFFDGAKTQVVAVAGTLLVQNGGSMAKEVVARGSALSVFGAETNFRVESQQGPRSATRTAMPFLLAGSYNSVVTGQARDAGSVPFMPVSAAAGTSLADASVSEGHGGVSGLLPPRPPLPPPP